MGSLTVGSLFSGIGGFDRGLEDAGMEVRWQVENDPQARAVLAHHWPDVDQLEDVHEVTSESVPRVDLICGGFPCTDVSVAGKRAGLAGERSGLWFEFHRILGALRPGWCLIENVPGLLSSNGGRDMGTLLGSLGELGYWWTYRVLDSQYFGVAQRRRRVFIVGHLGSPCPAEVLFDAASLQRNPPTRSEAGAGVAALSASGVGTSGAGDNQAQAGHIQVAQCHGSNVGPMGTLRTPESSVPFLTHTLRAEGFDAGEDGTGRGTPLVAFHATQDPISGEVAPAQGGRARIGVMTTAPRRITPRECERLQGFPDDHTLVEYRGKPMAGGPRYRMMGNAVTVNVAEWIGRRILMTPTPHPSSPR